ncbi:MAG: hypothetical protein JSU69_00120 [Candidatus Zixiibacteriota bacterium]|nr:MAG: hypothetical protein JSU69_00120 [candidate division Zixibacteria bacterium]
MSPMNSFIEILPVFIVFPTMYFIIKVIFEYFTRKRLIEKGLVGDEVKGLFEFGTARYLPSSLKWGLVLTLVGVALVVMRAISEYVPDEIVFGVVLIAAGAGLLIYYFAAAKKAGEIKANSKMQ